MKYIGQHIFDYVASFRQNVGVGTDTPSAALHAYATTGIISESPSNASITIRRNDNVQYGSLLKYHSGNTEKWVAGLSDAGDFTNSTGNEYFIGTAKTSPVFLINSSGKVGIGTDNPQKKLDIAGGDIRLDNSKGIFFATTDGNIGRVGITGDESSDFIQLKVDNSNSHLLRLNTTGVGIGLTNPSEKLHVSGNITLGNNKKITFRDSAGNDSSGLFYTSNTLFKLVQANSGELRLSTGFNDNANNKITFYTQGSLERMRIANDGNVSINNDLTVTGNLTVSGTTTTINTANLNVEDKNITLNYSTGDSSSTADGAGITIQDAVDSSTDATILWDASTDRFDFSNDIQLPDNKILNLGSGSADLQLLHDGNNSHVVNYTGDLKITNNANDKDIIFNCDDGSGGNTAYITIDGSTNRVNFNKPIKMADNTKINVGSGLDLQLVHDSFDSYINNFTGNLNIVNRADDKDIIFQSDDGSGNVTEYFRLDGSALRSVFLRDFLLADSVKGRYGSSGDLEIYHDGSDSYIDHTGTGNLYVRQGTDDAHIIFQCDDGSGGLTDYVKIDGNNQFIRFDKNTYHPDGKRITLGNGQEGRIFYESNILKITQTEDNGDIAFFNDDGSGGVTEYFRVDGGEEKVIFNKPVKFDFDVFTESNAELNLDAINTTGSGTVVKGGFLNPATEAQAVHQPQIVNDLAGFFKWGTIVTSGLFQTRSGSSGSFSYSNEWQASNANWNRAFDSTSSHPGSFFSNNGVDGNSVTPGVIELQWPTEITYSLNVGIVFGANSFTPTNVKIEAYKGDGAGGFAWQTLCDLTGNTENVILRKVDGNSGIGSATKRLKFTLGGSNTSLGYFRIHTIYMANYQAGHNNISGLGLDFTKGVHSLQKYDLNYVWGSFFPAQDNTYDLGSSGYEWKDGYFDGTVYTDGLNVDGNGEADRMTLNGSNFPQLFLIEGSGNSKTLQLGVTGDSAYFKKSDDTGSLIIRNSSNTNVALFSFATGNTTFGGDITSSGDITGNRLIAPNVYAQNLYITSSGTSAVNRIDNDTSSLYITYGGISNRALEISNSNGNATFAGTITSSNLATKNVVLVHGAGGVVGNSGSNSSDSHTWTITHGMGSGRNYKVEVMLNSGNYDTIYPDITRPSDTTIVITFSAAVANSAYKALILKCE